MKHAKRKLQLDRVTVRPLTLEHLSRVVGGTDLGGETVACDDLSDLICPGSMTGNYSVKPCPYSGDCM
jgi:hypothetical protein